MADVPIHDFGKIVLRTPLLPINKIKEFIFEKDYISKMEIILSDPIVKEAIYLSSPALFDKLDQLSIVKNKSAKEYKSLIISFGKYLLRMSTRPVPFGLLAGNSVGEFGNKTKIVLDTQASIQKYIRIDIGVLYLLSIELQNITEIKNQLKFVSNNSIHEFNQFIRYYKINPPDSPLPYTMKFMEKDGVINLIIHSCNVEITYEELLKLLINSGIESHIAKRKIDEAIENQLIVSELYPKATGTDYFSHILNVMSKINNKSIYNNLLDIEERLKEINSIVGIEVNKYKEVSNLIKAQIFNSNKDLFYYSSYYRNTIEFTIDEKLKQDLKRVLTILNKLSPYQEIKDITNFKRRFRERYQGQEVALLDVLDIDTGIGFKDFTYSMRPDTIVDILKTKSKKGNNLIRWNEIDSFIHKKYIEAVAKQNYQIEITERELQHFDSNWNDVLQNFPVLLNIFKESDTDNINLLISRASGAAANILGRFGDNEEIHSLINELIIHENLKNKDAIIAEIVHLPDLKLGNISIRQNLRNYEIPYLAQSGVAKDKQLSLDDLTISLRNNLLVLKSKKLNKEIIPRLTTAHSFHRNALPIYYFLSALQLQKVRSGFGFSWGIIEEQSTFLPRVVSKNFILSRAQWNFSKDDLSVFTKLKSGSLILSEIKKWKAKYKIPDEVVIAEGDNELYINFNSHFCIDIFLNEIKNKDKIKLIEFLFNEENSVVKAKDGYYASQFIIPVQLNN